MQPPENMDARVWAWLIGAAGAVISMQFIQGLTWPQKLMMAVSGTVMSVVLTQPVVEFVGMPAAWADGVAFLVGLFGWSAVGSIIAAIRKADWWGLIQDAVRRLIGRGGQ